MSLRGTADRLSPTELGAWQGLLRVITPTLRTLDNDLKQRHALSESKYDVLIQLGLSPRRRLSISELANQVLMSPSGLSRLIDELAREKLVVRERHGADARSVQVVLTPTGRTRLRAANRTHLQGVRRLILDKLSNQQLSQLNGIWATLEGSAARIGDT